MFPVRYCVFCRLTWWNGARDVIRYGGRNIWRSTGIFGSERTPEIKDTDGKSEQRSPVGIRLPKPQLLKENILTIPNALCLSRIALSPVLAYCIVNENYRFGLAIFAYAAVSDLLDGWIARTFPSQQSVLGSALDPVADKVLVSVLVLSLTYVDLIPIPLTVLIVARDGALIASGFVMRYITLDPPRTLSRYFDITAPSVQLKPTWISKVNTGVQFCMVGLSLAAPVFGYVNHPALQALWYVTAGTTVASGLSYVFAKDTYEVLRKRSKREHNKR